MLIGNLSNVMNLFSGQPNSQAANLLQNNITSGVISKLVSKLGLSQGVADTVVSIAIPALINLISRKNSAIPNDNPSPPNEIFKGKKADLAVLPALSWEKSLNKKRFCFLGRGKSEIVVVGCQLSYHSCYLLTISFSCSNFPDISTLTR